MKRKIWLSVFFIATMSSAAMHARYTEDDLLYAARWKDEKTMEKIIASQEVDINAHSKKSNQTALVIAAQHGRGKIVNILLQTPGIKVNARGKGERTALMWAAYNGHEKIVDALLQMPGIELNAQGTKGKTALDLAKTKIIKNKLKAAGAASGASGKII